MTHGDIWLPIDPSNPRSPMLYCEAWSDGYLSGVGYGASCSSARLAEICALSVAFAGSPFFHLPSANAFQSKEEDFAADSILDALGEDADTDRLTASAEAALALARAGDIKALQANEYANIPLQDKLDKGLGINAEIREADHAWSYFLEQAPTLEGAEAAKMLIDAEEASDKTSSVFCESNAYFWRDGRFWVAGDVGETRVCIPLIQACALSRRAGCYGDFPGYLSIITNHDRADLMAIVDELRSRGLPWDNLLDGHCSGQLTSMVEASEIEQAAGAAKKPSPARARSV